jgi:SAM-dependent methyltransferase
VVNVDAKTVDGFGDEWSRFDQSSLATRDSREVFEAYFRLFPWDSLPQGAAGFDLGCGSGRWAKLVAKKVATLHCIDASEEALSVARRNLAEEPNCVFHRASVDAMPLADNSMDFGYSLGVLHHVPDTAGGIRDCVSKLKPGAPFLLYLYYAFDNRPSWFRVVWKVSDYARRAVSHLPHPMRHAASQAIAMAVYLPLARSAKLFERAGFNVANFPLSAYRERSVYVMRTDALDRFGTRLEHRFTADQIRQMMEAAGLERVVFNDSVPFWCAVGYKGPPKGLNLCISGAPAANKVCRE